jgi:(1->4)-alpha-D-glucan 1-alpha-D-glucosylmutase
VYKALDFRKANRPLFDKGEYLPLTAAGVHAGSICSFVRKTASEMAVVAVPRFLTRLISGGESLPFGKAVWEDTHLILPEGVEGAQFRNVFTREVLSTVPMEEKTGLKVADIYSCFPAALLEKIA